MAESAPAKRRLTIGSIIVNLSFFGFCLWLAWYFWRDGLGFGGTLVLLFVGAAAIFAIFQWAGRRVGENRMRSSFPGYEGERFPILKLLGYVGPDGRRSFDSAAHYSLGVSGDSLFFIRNKDKAFEAEGGELVGDGVPGRYLHLPRDSIVEVEVEELSEEEIEANARDNRDPLERMAETAVGMLLQSRVKTKIVPFAAFVTIRVARAGGTGSFLLAMPTEIDSEALEHMGRTVEGDLGEGWLADRVSELAGAGAKEAVGALVGEGLSSFGFGAHEIFTGGMASGSTKGARGWLMAWLVAERIRAFAEGRAGLANS